MLRPRYPREFRPSLAGGEYSGMLHRAFRRRLRTPAPARRSSRCAPSRTPPGERCTAADTSCRNRSHIRNHSIASWQSTSRASICLRRGGGAFRRRGMPARLRKPHGEPFGEGAEKGTVENGAAFFTVPLCAPSRSGDGRCVRLCFSPPGLRRSPFPDRR